MPRHSQDDINNRNRDRDEEGRFTSGSRDDNDRTSGRGREDRDRDDEGRFTRNAYSGSDYNRSQQEDENNAFNDWHAYGHARGWHAHQQGRHGQANERTYGARNDQGRGGPERSNQERGSQGRGWHGDPEGHARAGSLSHGGMSQGRSRMEDDDDDRADNRSRDENGRFTGNRH